MSQKSLVTIMVLCAGLGGILYGYDIGVISGALLFLRKTIAMSQNQMGIIVGAVLGGSLLGTIMTGYCADRWGRRSMIIVASMVFIIGVACLLMATNFRGLLLSRLLLGIAVGIVSVAVPLYLSEVAPAEIRGKSVTIFQLFLTFGILAAYLVDLYFTPSGNWHAMFAVILIPAVILLVSMLLLPESPRWLFAKSKTIKAELVLKRIRLPESIQQERQEILESLQEKHGSWRDLFKKQLALPLFICLFIAVSNQLTGINCFFQYAPVILKQVGFASKTVAMIGTVGLGLMNFLTTIIAIFLIDKIGRKKLLMFGAGGIVITQLYLGVVAHFVQSPYIEGWLSIIGLMVYVFVYAIGPGVVVWLAISELLPTKVRGKAIALALFINSLVATLLSTIFVPMVNYLSMAGTYWFFAFFCVLYFLVAAFLLPETKGKSLEKIQMYFENKYQLFNKKT